MGQPAASQGDSIQTTGAYTVLVGTMVPFVFQGPLSQGLSNNVRVQGRAAATMGSAALNTLQPASLATIIGGSTTVRINGKPAARANDMAIAWSGPPAPVMGSVTAVGVVSIG